MNLEQIKDALDAIKIRIRMLFTRGNVTLVYTDQTGEIQRVQISGLAGELLNDVDHAQPYGLAARPLVGAEAFMASVLGQRGQLTALIIGDPRYRPIGIKDGEVVVWSKFGQTVWLHDDGTLTVSVPNTVKVTAPKVEVEAPEVIVNASTVAINANNVTIAAQSASLDCNDISFGGEGGQPVARVGDMVNVGSGSSAGLWPIVSGSEKMKVA
ncbi:phage baseplate assembly protein V [Thalassospira sp. MCCC 1A01428]|uniref:phage baseplate assembly protein V n=1 Tax=Thalassospira sp. MCCC 1A01428 TaxID=1470575 RepID=UPI000A1EE887|nr:phage baseplate assembly protein V [Thalassospira sp. MCCC 1A01428]